MSQWNAFDELPATDPETLGNSVPVGKLCTCEHYYSNHDELGCVRRGCDCKISLSTLLKKVDP